MIWLWLACAVALILDAGILRLLPEVSSSVGYLLALSMGHTTICLLFSLVVLKLLPDPYHKPRFESHLFAFTIIAFIPVLGMIGLLVCIIPALRHRRLNVQYSEWNHPRILGLPTHPVEPSGFDGISQAGELAGPLQHAADPKKRTAALIATLSLKDQYAVPLLRLAMKDTEDDIRLLAYALLNRKERTIEARIRERNLQLDNGDSEQLFLQHKALAHDYWALAHISASPGRTQLMLCDRAHQHVQAALEWSTQDGGLLFLFGRILLNEKQLDAASGAFESARQSGIDARKIEPFLAEIAFLRQRYSDVKNHLSQACNGRSLLRLNKASTYWGVQINDAIRT